MSVSVITIAISFTLAVCSFISSVLTVVLNNRDLLKVKRMELQQKEMENTTLYVRNILENYLKYAGQSITLPDPSTEKEYGTYYFLALTYLPLELHPKLTELNAAIMEYNQQEATKLLENLTPSIAELLKKCKYHTDVDYLNEKTSTRFIKRFRNLIHPSRHQ